MRTTTVPFREAFLFWLKLGFINFGGPAGQIAIMHRELVERKRWVTEELFLRALNFCMMLLNLSVFFGSRVLIKSDGALDSFAVVMALVSFLVMLRYRLPIHVLVPIGAAVGMVWKLCK